MANQADTNGEVLKDRIVALSDGIFAFALTLLVLNLVLPEEPVPRTSNELAEALLGLKPKLMSWVISFLVIGSYWIGQHQMFRFIQRADHQLAWLSVYFLMCISFVPFPTSVLGSEGDNQVAVMFYAGTMVMAGLLRWLIWRYATDGHRLVAADLDPRLISLYSLRMLSPALVFLASIAISFFSPSLAMYSWIMVAGVHPVLQRIYGPIADF